MAASPVLVSPIMSYVTRDNPGFVEPPVAPEEGRQSVKLLDMKHAEYTARFEAWLDLSLLYEGGAALKARAERLLKKRPREDEEVYAARLDRFTYENILGTGLGWYGAAMFDNEPEIMFDEDKTSGSGSDYYTEFLSNCDGNGTTYIDFFKRVFQILLTYGSGWVLTDLRSVEPGQEPQTRFEEVQRGLTDPHVVCFTPLHVINWKYDSMGKLQWVIARTEVQEQEFLRRPEIVTTWYYYDKTSYKVYEDRRSIEEDTKVATQDAGRMANLLRSGTHCLAHEERVPMHRVTLSEGLWLANRAYLLLIDHLNQDNTLGWSLFMSNLAMPVVIGDGDPTSMTYSETGYLHFPSGTTYEWSEPAGTSFSHSAKRVESLREECFRSMHLQAQGRSMRATPAMQSGKSKVLDMAPAKQILSGMGDDLRKHMQDVLIDVKDARHEPDVDPDVRGFNFEDDMTTEEVFSVTSLLNMRIPSKKFEKYVQKKVAKAWMPDANREELVEVFKEIEAGPTMEEREQQDLKDRVKLAQQGMKSALTSKPPSSNMPPGRGGSGPSPS